VRSWDRSPGRIPENLLARRTVSVTLLRIRSYVTHPDSRLSRRNLLDWLAAATSAAAAGLFTTVPSGTH
jgi:hypothetical protein